MRTDNWIRRLAEHERGVLDRVRDGAEDDLLVQPPGGGGSGGAGIQHLGFQAYPGSGKFLFCAPIDSFGRVSQLVADRINVFPAKVYAGFADEDGDGVPDPVDGSGNPVSAAYTLESPDADVPLPTDAQLNNASITASPTTGATVTLLGTNWEGAYAEAAIVFPATQSDGIKIEVLRGPSNTVETTITVPWVSGTVSRTFTVVAGTPKVDYRLRVSRIAGGGAGVIRVTHKYDRYRTNYNLRIATPRLYQNDLVPVYAGPDGRMYTDITFQVPRGSVLLRQF